MTDKKELFKIIFTSALNKSLEKLKYKNNSINNNNIKDNDNFISKYIII